MYFTIRELVSLNPKGDNEGVTEYLRRLEKVCDGKFTFKSMRSFYYNRMGLPVTEEIEVKPIVNKTGISLEEFEKKYDSTIKIRQHLAGLGRGELFTMQDLLFDLQMSIQQKSKFMDEEFSQYRGTVNNTIYWGHPDDISSLKKRRLLR